MELDDFVKKNDIFDYTVRETIRDLTRIELISQVWKGITWKHTVLIVTPSSITSDQALLYITGSYSGKLEYLSNQSGELNAVRWIAETTGSPVAVLFDVPNQPYQGMVEDEIISYTVGKFVESGDPEWLLLFPMTKSAVRAMDAVSDYFSKKGISLKGYTVTGASKRGWTTWLTSAVDGRVKAIAPMVYNNLNVPEQVRNQVKLLGSFSPELKDYYQRGLFDLLLKGDKVALEAVRLIDPFTYLDRITMPKLIINGANDQFWAINADQFYYDRLLGEKRILYLPNSDHSLQDRDRLLSTLKTFHEMTSRGEKLPDPKAEATYDDDGALITAYPEEGAYVWTAESESMNFVKSRWQRIKWSKGFKLKGEGRNKAAFVEFELKGRPNFYLSSNMFVVQTRSRKPCGLTTNRLNKSLSTALDRHEHDGRMVAARRSRERARSDPDNSWAYFKAEQAFNLRLRRCSAL